MSKLLKVEDKEALFLHSSTGKGSLGEDEFEFGHTMAGCSYVYYKGRYCIINMEAFVRLSTKLIDKELDKTKEGK